MTERIVMNPYRTLQAHSVVLQELIERSRERGNLAPHHYSRIARLSHVEEEDKKVEDIGHMTSQRVARYMWPFRATNVVAEKPSNEYQITNMQEAIYAWGIVHSRMYNEPIDAGFEIEKKRLRQIKSILDKNLPKLFS
jgi:hypothetical protein